MPIYIGKDLVEDLGVKETEIILGSYCPECYVYELRRTGASGYVDYKDCYSGQTQNIGVLSALRRYVSARQTPVVLSGGILVTNIGQSPINPCWPGEQYPGIGVNCENITFTGGSNINVIGYVECYPAPETPALVFTTVSVGSQITVCAVSGSITPSGAGFVVNSTC
jgi:hypothetical protein